MAVQPQRQEQQSQNSSGWAWLPQPDIVHEIKRKVRERGLEVADLKVVIQRMRHDGAIYEKLHYGGGYWDFVFSVSLAPARNIHLVMFLNERLGLQLGVFREGDIPSRWVANLIQDFNEALDSF